MKMNCPIILLYLIFAFFSAFATSQIAPHSDPMNEDDWVIIENISDEFNAELIDRKKWYVQGEDDHYENNFTGRAPSQFAPHAVSIDDGFLTITTRWEPNYPLFLDKIQDGRKYENITTGALISKAKFKYGYMESRSKAADGPISSSFWTTGKNGELDVFEHWGHNPKNPDSAYRLHTSFHDWRDPKSKTWGKRIWTNEHKLDFRVADDFHIYGLQWAPNFIKVFVDGYLIRCVTKQEMGDLWVATNEQKVWLDSEVFPWETNGQKATAEDYPAAGRQYIVDYVRIWQTKENQQGCEEQKNQLKNSNFENSIDHWKTQTKDFQEVATEGRNDSNALLLTGKNKLSQTVTVKPNTKYILSGWLNSPGTNMKNVWHNAWLGVSGFLGQKQSKQNQINKRHFKNTYQYHSIQFTTSESAKEVEVFVHNNWSSHPVLVDDLTLLELKTLSN